MSALLCAPYAICWVAAALALLAYLLTLQWGISSGGSPYTTDVGEIQNALPRWGTLHYSGYPLYTLLGSLVVSALHLVGIAPTAGSSLYSALWGAAAIGLLAALALELGAPRWAALAGALIGGASLSFWVNSSLAEVHTMTMALTLASLLCALRLRRNHTRGSLLWLVFWFSQAVAHQRAAGLLIVPVLILCWRQWRLALRNILPILGIFVIAFLTYLYLPIRDWMGADWTFGQVGTWQGFWRMLLDTKVERVVTVPANLGEWWERIRLTLGLLAEDMPLPLMALGLAGLWLGLRRRDTAVSLALTATALGYAAVMLVVWEGTVSDALLAVKLPVALLAALGLGLLAGEAGRRWRQMLPVSAALLSAVIIYLGINHAPQVLAITRDDSIQATLATVRSAEFAPGRVTLLVPWGHDYWALRYAQSYEGQFSGITIVDHNADPAQYASDGFIYTLSKDLNVLPLDWWQQRLDDVQLDSAGAGMVRIASAATKKPQFIPKRVSFDLGNGIVILGVRLETLEEGERLLSIIWQASEPVEEDYAVAVHLVGTAADGSTETVVGQADSANPVDGLYPTSRWQQGEIVRDDYLLAAPDDALVQSIELGMYRQLASDQFANTNWMMIPWQMANDADWGVNKSAGNNACPCRVTTDN
ncbi:MAG: DUF2723 domain-containing protein [Chloroflexi bacterium]|nr:DUF2723 domain-containing protein [Chloroflexota bacterium]